MRPLVVIAVLAGCARTGPVASAGTTAPSTSEPGVPAEDGASPDATAPAEPPVAPPSTKPLSVVGAAPAWPGVLALARAQGLRKPAKAAAMVGLGGDRWAAAIRTTDRDGGDEGRSWTTHVLIIDTAGDPLRLIDRRALVSWSDDAISDPERAPVAVFADDYDGDGERELLVRFGFALMLCGIGEVERRELRIYGTTDDGHLRPQIALTLDDRIYFGASTGRESFADRTGDGRADLVIRERSEYEDVDGVNDGRPIRDKRELVYGYSPERDEYAGPPAKPSKGRMAVDFRTWDTCEEGEAPGSSAL